MCHILSPPRHTPLIDTKKKKFLKTHLFLERPWQADFLDLIEKTPLIWSSFLGVLKPSTSNTGHFMDREKQHLICVCALLQIFFVQNELF